MRMSTLFQRTARQSPSEADTASHSLLLKAGMISQLAAGIYSFLPLGLRTLRKIEQIVREEMDAIGSQEILMPALQPRELWEESGRVESFGGIVFELRDRRERAMVLAPTHEEVVTTLGRQNIRSYRELPAIVYQIQTKFRDEPRPRSGLIRVREFIMKDAYSFHPDEASLEETYQAMCQAYRNIFSRCGLPALMVEADSGAIGGKASHEFMLLAPTGEDHVLRCPVCDYAANAEKAEFIKPPLPAEGELPPEEVATPGTKTIADVARFLNVPEAKTAKAVFYSADGKVVFVVIRGDLEVNQIKLKNTLKATDLRLATDEEVAAAGLVAGYASPVGVRGVKVVADDSLLLGSNYVAGANKPDAHLRNVNYPRDFEVDVMTDLALAGEGDRCARCREGAFIETRGIEVGHVFKLGTVFSEQFGVFFLDREGQQRTAIMGCYGIGVGRVMGAAVEQNHDEKGIVWPAAIAPMHIYLAALSADTPEVAERANRVYQEMTEAGLEVLFDDRVETPGVKFNDADLLGLPLRVTISPRTLRNHAGEIKGRTEAEGRQVPLERLTTALKEAVAQLVAQRA